MEKLDEFISELLEARGVEETLENHAELLEKVNDKIDRAILAALPGEALDRMEGALEDGSATENMVKNLVEGSGINVEEITIKALEDFRDEFLNGEA